MYMITVHGVDPDYIREGGSLPVMLTLADTTGKDCILIPMGRSDDGAHSQNEKLNISNFKNGVRKYLWQRAVYSVHVCVILVGSLL